MVHSYGLFILHWAILFCIASSKSCSLLLSIGLHQGCLWHQFCSELLCTGYLGANSRSIRFGGFKISSAFYGLPAPLGPIKKWPSTWTKTAAECEVAGKRLGTSKSVAMVLSWKRVSKRSVPAPSGEVQVVCDLVHKWGKIGAGNWQVDWGSICCIEERAKLDHEDVNLLVSLYSNPQLWSQATQQEVEMNFIHRVAGLILRDRERSSDIWKGVESLLVHIKRSQLRCSGCLLWEVFWADHAWDVSFFIRPWNALTYFHRS